MSAPTTLQASPNAIFSPASACGRTPCDGGGWPDDRPVWTGSCPCQPFSVAGVGGGMDDQRHLWPYWFHLIEQRRPAVVFGEQVEAAIRYGWLDLVQADVEGIGYAFAAAGIPAAGVGAPHIRQRIFFVADGSMADPDQEQRRWWATGEGLQSNGAAVGRQQSHSIAESNRAAFGLDDAHDARLEGYGCGHQAPGGRIDEIRSVAEAGKLGGMDNAISLRFGERREDHGGHDWKQSCADGCVPERQPTTGPTNGYWRNADWLRCRDERWRPVEPGTCPLAHGATARVGRLRAYGNAICAPLAAEFVSAYLECRP